MNVHTRVQQRSGRAGSLPAHAGETGRSAATAQFLLITDQGHSTDWSWENLLQGIRTRMELRTWADRLQTGRGNPDHVDTSLPADINATYYWLAAAPALSEFRVLFDRPSQGGPSLGKSQATEVTLSAQPEQVENVLREIIEAAKDEVFEDGMESAFSKALASLVATHGHTDQLKELFAYWIVLGKATPYVISEALRCLGRIDHPPTQRYRRWLLERSLQGRSPIIRDAAGLGLASMDDPESAPAIRDAIAREGLPELRENLKQVLDNLEG